jgi:hypothetical protein
MHTSITNATITEKKVDVFNPLFHPYPASPIKGEELKLPSPVANPVF